MMSPDKGTQGDYPIMTQIWESFSREYKRVRIDGWPGIDLVDRLAPAHGRERSAADDGIIGLAGGPPRSGEKALRGARPGRLTVRRC